MNPTSLFPTLWHRRAASVSVITMLVTLALLGYTYFATGQSGDTVLREAIGASVIALIASSLARMHVPDRVASWLSFVGFALGVGGIGLALMSDTGATIHSVLVVELSLVTLVAGLFGPIAWLILIAVIAPYFVAHFTITDQPLSSTLAFVAFYTLPLAASWLLWHGGPRRPTQAQGDRAYSTLAEQLNQVSNESEIVISTIADGVVALNQKGEVQLINPAAQKTLGWKKDDSMGLDYHSIIKLQDKQGAAVDDNHNPITQALHLGKPLERSDLTMATNSGKSFQARLSVTPVDTGGGGVIIVFRDVTAEKAEEREQAEFVSTASHEMRTPVATIEGYLGLALNPNTAVIDDKARVFLTKAHESAQHLGRLFQDLLDVSKADDGRLRNMPTVTDLVAFCEDIISGLSTKATEKGLTISFAPLVDASMTERKLAPVYYADVDNDHLREIMNNLVENAIKYTKQGTVTVNVSGDNENCVITVKDSGIGIPREDIAHLFQKFYRVDNTDTREIGGTGLGLYLCRRLVEFIGGKIWVESEYGHGSTFSVSLPRLGYDDAQARLKAIAEQRERQAANAQTTGENSGAVPTHGVTIGPIGPTAPVSAPPAQPQPQPQPQPVPAPVPPRAAPAQPPVSPPRATP